MTYKNFSIINNKFQFVTFQIWNCIKVRFRDPKNLRDTGDGLDFRSSNFWDKFEGAFDGDIHVIVSDESRLGFENSFMIETFCILPAFLFISNNLSFSWIIGSWDENGEISDNTFIIRHLNFHSQTHVLTFCTRVGNQFEAEAEFITIGYFVEVASTGTDVSNR